MNALFPSEHTASERPSSVLGAEDLLESQAQGRGGVLVLGLGNDILTDDAVGLVVASRLRERFAVHPNVFVVECLETGLGLLDQIVGHRDLVVIDSVQTGRESPGHLHEVGEADIKTLPGMSPHFLGVGEILALGRLMELPMPARVVLFAVEAADPFTLGTKLSETVAQALPAILERVTSQVSEWSAGQEAS